MDERNVYLEDTYAYPSSLQWSPPAEINFDQRLLNFLWLDVTDERDSTALKYRKDFNHDPGDLLFIKDVEQFYSPLPDTALHAFCKRTIYFESICSGQFLGIYCFVVENLAEIFSKKCQIVTSQPHVLHLLPMGC